MLETKESSELYFLECQNILKKKKYNVMKIQRLDSHYFKIYKCLKIPRKLEITDLTHIVDVIKTLIHHIREWAAHPF